MQCLSDRRNDQTGHKADKQTCNDAGDHKYREIEKQIQVLDNEYSHQNLANVVADAAGNTDTHRGETFDPAAENHHCEAQKSPGDTVEQSGHIAECKGYKQNTYNGNHQCLSGIQQIQSHNDHQIGQSELDAGNAEVKWNQGDKEDHISE